MRFQAAALRPAFPAADLSGGRRDAAFDDQALLVVEAAGVDQRLLLVLVEKILRKKALDPAESLEEDDHVDYRALLQFEAFLKPAILLSVQRIHFIHYFFLIKIRGF